MDDYSKVDLFQHGDLSEWKVQVSIESFRLIENPQDYFDTGPRFKQSYLFPLLGTNAAPWPLEARRTAARRLGSRYTVKSWSSSIGSLPSDELSSGPSDRLRHCALF